MWGAFVDECMVGTVSLDDDRGLPIVGRIAVSQAYVGRLGRRLLTPSRGGAPARPQGALGDGARAGLLRSDGLLVVALGMERDLLLSECFTCRQYGKECHPQAVCKTLVP